MFARATNERGVAVCDADGMKVGSVLRVSPEENAARRVDQTGARLQAWRARSCANALMLSRQIHNSTRASKTRDSNRLLHTLTPQARHETP